MHAYIHECVETVSNDSLMEFNVLGIKDGSVEHINNNSQPFLLSKDLILFRKIIRNPKHKKFQTNLRTTITIIIITIKFYTL